MPELYGHFSHQDVVDVVATIRRANSERILRIEENDFGDVDAYTGDEAGGITYMFRRENGRLVGCGGGYWSGRPGKRNWPLNPGLRYERDENN
jgi:hypothetical protein